MTRSATHDRTQPPRTRRWSNGRVSPLDDVIALETAKLDLRQHYTTESVADRAGYASVSGFSAAFQRKTGKTPAAWYKSNVRDSR